MSLSNLTTTEVHVLPILLLNQIFGIPRYCHFFFLSEDNLLFRNETIMSLFQFSNSPITERLHALSCMFYSYSTSFPSSFTGDN